MVSDCDWSLLYVASCNGVFAAAAAAVVAADGSIRHHLVVFTQLLKTAVLRHCIVYPPSRWLKENCAAI